MFEALQAWQRGHWRMLQSRRDENRRVVRAYIGITWQLRRSQLFPTIPSLSIKEVVCYIH